MPGAYRLKFQFSVPPELGKLLNELQTKTGVNSWSEVLRDAICSYTWIVDSYEKGYRVFLEGPSRIRKAGKRKKKPNVVPFRPIT